MNPGDPRDGRFRLPASAPPDRLDRVLRAARPGLSWAALRDLVQRGKIRVDGATVTDAGTLVRGGAEVVIDTGARRADARPTAAAAAAFERERIVHLDRHVVVVNKPAGVDTVPWDGASALADAPRAGEAGRAVATLDAQLRTALGAPVRVVQRLDRDTTGLLVFARTAEAEQGLTQQLRRHAVHRSYLGLAHGRVEPQTVTIRTFLGQDRGDGLRGSIANEKLGKEAITHVAVVERLRGATLVACRLETGRTHQIRIHLAERGHMLLGERGYVRDHVGAVLAAPRILLHAAELGFVHPVTEAELRFAQPMPDDMAQVLATLRGG